jgi:hypothetical protein
MCRPGNGMSAGGIGDQQRYQCQHCMYAHCSLRSPFQCPDSSGLYDYRYDEEDGAKCSAFGSGMQLGVHVGKAVETDGPDQIEEKANADKYVGYYVQRRH